MKKNIVILPLLLNFILSLIFLNFSIFICGTIYISILFMVTGRLLGNDKTIYKRITIIWLMQICCMLVIYFILKITYGVPYDMIGMDDYLADIEWTDGCIENHLYTIQQVKNSYEYAMFNNKSFLVLIVWMKLFCNIFGGYHTLNFRMFNLFIWLLTAIIMGKYACEYLSANDKVTKKIITTIALFPNALFIASLVYRDVIVTFLIVITFYLWSHFSQKTIKNKLFVLSISVSIIYFTYYLRIQAVLYVCMAIAVGIANIYPEKSIFTHKINKSKGFVLLAISIFVFIIGGKLLTNLRRYLALYLGINSQSNGIQAIINRVPIFPVGWILRTGFYFLLPMYYRDIIPIDLLDDPVSVIRAFVSWGTIFSMFLYPYVFLYWKKMNNIVVMFLFMFVSTAIVTSGFRHVLITYPMLFTMGILGEKNTSIETRRKNRLICSGAVTIYLIGIIAVKVFL